MSTVNKLEAFQKMLEAAKRVNSISTEDLLTGKLSSQDRACIAMVYESENHDLELDASLLALLTTAERRTGVEKFFSRFGLMGIQFEVDIANDIIRAADPYRAYRAFQHYRAYRETVEMEVLSAQLKRGDRVLFLGSGPLPITLIQFHEYYGIQSAGIELLPQIAALSRELLASLGYADTIPVTTGNHFSIKPDMGFKHIIVAYDAEPKEEIFAHLREVLPDEATVSYRFNMPSETVSFRSFWKEQNGFQEFPGFTTLSLQHPLPPARNSTAFLRKQAQA